MKRVLLLATAAALAAVTASADLPPDGHKVYWCHYPPGQGGAKVIPIVIDEHAMPAHYGHVGDGPATSPGVDGCQQGGGTGGSG